MLYVHCSLYEVDHPCDNCKKAPSYEVTTADDFGNKVSQFRCSVCMKESIKKED
jgi:hypothetical protein